MKLSSALSQVSVNNFTEFTALNELLDSDLVSNALSQAGVATIRKRKLPMEQMVWAVVGMALFS
jgi:hypothetical protein